MSEEAERMMKRWRNVLCPVTLMTEVTDREIREINKMEKSLGEIPEEVNRIRALISRVDPLCYCHIFNNIDFIISAIDSLSYPGSPSMDVLERCVLHGGQLPPDVRERAKGYIHSLDSWLQGKPLNEALEDKPQHSKLIERTYFTVGEKSAYKEWLVASLAKTLKEQAYTPIDWISQFPHEEVIHQMYKITLDRAPTTEEVRLASQELKEGRSPATILRKIISSKEYVTKNLPKGAREIASDRDFVVQVYETLLGRGPSPDDLEFRVNEIRKAGSRNGLMEGVIHSREHFNRQLRRIAEVLKAS